MNDNNEKIILLDEYEYYRHRNHLLHIKLCLNKMLSHCRSSLHKIYNINDVRNKTTSTTTQNKKNVTIKSSISNSIINSIDDKYNTIDYYSIPSYNTNSNTTNENYDNKKRKYVTNNTMTIDVYMKQLQHYINYLLFYRKLMIESAKIYSARGDCIIDLDMIASYE